MVVRSKGYARQLRRGQVAIVGNACTDSFVIVWFCGEYCIPNEWWLSLTGIPLLFWHCKRKAMSYLLSTNWDTLDVLENVFWSEIDSGNSWAEDSETVHTHKVACSSIWVMPWRIGVANPIQKKWVVAWNEQLRLVVRENWVTLQFHLAEQICLIIYISTKDMDLFLTGAVK